LFFDWLRDVNLKTPTPIVVFLDEAEQFLSDISSPSNSADMAELSLKSAFREWWDGLDQSTGGIILIAATNRPDMFQEANLDRFDHVFTLPNLDLQGRTKLFQAKLGAAETQGFRFPTSKEMIMELGAISFGLSGRAITRSVDQAISSYEKDSIGFPVWQQAENNGETWMEAGQSRRLSIESIDHTWLKSEIESQRKRAGLPVIKFRIVQRFESPNLRGLDRYLPSDLRDEMMSDTGFRLAMLVPDKLITGTGFGDMRNDRRIVDVETYQECTVVYLDGRIEQHEPQTHKGSRPTSRIQPRYIPPEVEDIGIKKNRDTPHGVLAPDDPSILRNKSRPRKSRFWGSTQNTAG